MLPDTIFRGVKVKYVDGLPDDGTIVMLGGVKPMGNTSFKPCPPVRSVDCAVHETAEETITRLQGENERLRNMGLANLAAMFRSIQDCLIRTKPVMYPESLANLREDYERRKKKWEG